MDVNTGLLRLDQLTINERQRQKFDPKKMQELVSSIEKQGLFNAITVNLDTTTDAYELLAGERRCRAVQTLYEEEKVLTFGTVDVPLGSIPVVLYTNLTEEQKTEIELDENIKRQDLTWQEETEAYAKLHELRKKQNPEQTLEDTAKEVKKSRGDESPVTSQDRTKLRQAELLAPFLSDKEIQKASSQSRAFKILQDKLTEEFSAALDRTGIHDEVKEGEEGFDPTKKPASPHKLYARSMEDASAILPHQSFDLVIMDPPYGIGVEKFGGAQQDAHRYSEDDALGVNTKAIAIASQLAKEDAHMYIFCDLDLFHALREYTQALGWTVRRTPLIWFKGNRGHLSDGGVLGWRRTYEYILFAHRGGRTANGLRNDVIDVPADMERYHAAQKPSKLYEYLMDQSAQIGCRVLDLFAGSGVVFKAATECSMFATGFEIDKRAVALIETHQGIWRERDNEEEL